MHFEYILIHVGKKKTNLFITHCTAYFKLLSQNKYVAVDHSAAQRLGDGVAPKQSLSILYLSLFWSLLGDQQAK